MDGHVRGTSPAHARTVDRRRNPSRATASARQPSRALIALHPYGDGGSAHGDDYLEHVLDIASRLKELKDKMASRGRVATLRNRTRVGRRSLTPGGNHSSMHSSQSHGGRSNTPSCRGENMGLDELHAPRASWPAREAFADREDIIAVGDCSCCREGHANVQVDPLQKAIESADVVLFNSNGCPFCRKAQDALKANGIPYMVVDIHPHKTALRNRLGKSSAPAVFINGAYVGGCNDGTEPWMGVVPMLKNGKFKKLLNATRRTEP